MTDAEKVLLCRNMVRDFWEYLSEDKQQDGAEALIMALSSVLDFSGAPND